MTVQEIMEELDLEIDDLRWYCSATFANQFQQYKGRMHDLTRYIWSGELEKDLYHMEDTFFEELQSSMDRNAGDEHRIRSVLREVLLEKKRRAKPNGRHSHHTI